MSNLDDWDDVDNPRYTARSTQVNGHTVTVCLDDEGPLRPAFYYDIVDATGTKVRDGWASSPTQAAAVAVDEARRLEVP